MRLMIRKPRKGKFWRYCPRLKLTPRPHFPSRISRKALKHWRMKQKSNGRLLRWLAKSFRWSWKKVHELNYDKAGSFGRNIFEVRSARSGVDCQGPTTARFWRAYSGRPNRSGNGTEAAQSGR